MENQLQKVRIAAAVMLLTGSALAQRQPFSHKFHLTQVASCETCHRPDSDNLLPTPDQCVTCHDEVHIKEQKRVVPKFSHEQHLKMGNIAALIARSIDSGTYLSPPGDLRRHLDTKDRCAACHRGVPLNEKVTRDIHPHMADCLVCHAKIEPVDSCLVCHSKDMALKPATHTKDYLDDHASGKAKIDKTTCAVCHGRKFVCRGCH